MSQLIITSDQYDFIIYDLNCEKIVHKQITPELNCAELQGQGRPTYRPFGVALDNESIYIASNNRLGKFNKQTYRFESLIDVPLYINTHQIEKDGDFLCVTNTAANNIGIYDLKNNTQEYLDVQHFNWVNKVTPPKNVDEFDINHVNSLTQKYDKIYFCLHNKLEKNSYYGYIDKKSKEISHIASAGYAGHNIVFFEDDLYSLSTGTCELIKINLKTNNIIKHKIVNTSTFLRGLEIIGSKLVIGCSVNFKDPGAIKSSYILIVDLVELTYKKCFLEGIQSINDLKAI